VVLRRSASPQIRATSSEHFAVGTGHTTNHPSSCAMAAIELALAWHGPLHNAMPVIRVDLGAVAGWQPGEFDMTGVQLAAGRYDQS
jgi:alkanesulfonate monooxygenase SsuD/methylene tetrahydromethanopterin reductase-like flavin-dependent oxidoreductase (luciferase family)